MSAWYALNLRRGDLHVELTADDPVFMADEMARWLSVMGMPATTSRPASTTLSSPPPTPPQKAQPIAPPPSLTDRLSEHPPESVATSIQLPGEERPVDNEPTRPTEAPQTPTPSLSQEPVFEEDSSSATNALFQAEDDATSSHTPIHSDLPPAVESIADRGQPEPDDDFERVMSSLMNDLNTHPTESQSPVPIPDSSDIATTTPTTIPSGIYLHPGSTPQNTQPTLSKAPDNPNSYSALCARAGAATPEDHLLISAYALTTTDGIEHFTLSNLNEVIQASGHDAVNHSVLQVAVDKGLLVAVPDLSADATQYELTRHGRTTVELFI
ncbi:MAG: hypothetical protein U0003_02190 [Vampirovibrionales bacterium]